MNNHINDNVMIRVNRYCLQPEEYKGDRTSRKREAITAFNHLKRNLETIRANIKELKELYSEETIKRMLEDLDRKRKSELEGITTEILKYKSIEAGQDQGQALAPEGAEQDQKTPANM